MRTIRDFEERVHDEFAGGDIPGFVHLYAGEEASAAGVCSASRRPRRDRLHPPRARPLHRQGRRRQGDDGRDLRQEHRFLPRQGRLDAHRRPVQGHARRQRHRRRRSAADLRAGARVEAQGRRRGRGGVLRRRRVEPGHDVRVDEPGHDLEPAGDLRGGEQRLRRGDVVELVGGHRRHRRPGGRVRDARRDRRRVRLLRGARGGGRGRGAGPRGRRPDADRGQVHPLLRPLRGRPAALPRPARSPSARDKLDCLKRFRARVTEAGQLTDAQLDQIDAEVARLVDEAVAEAKAAPKPGADDLLTDVYVSY